MDLGGYPDSIYEGGMQGATYGLGNKASAGWTAFAKRLLPAALGGTKLPIGEQYRQDLAARNALTSAARAAHPSAFSNASIVGSAVPLLPFAGVGELPSIIGYGAAMGRAAPVAAALAAFQRQRQPDDTQF